MNEDEEGVEKNYKRAAEYYLEATELDNVEALDSLATLYETGGFGLRQDLKKAKQYRDEYQKQSD